MDCGVQKALWHGLNLTVLTEPHVILCRPDKAWATVSAILD